MQELVLGRLLVSGSDSAKTITLRGNFLANDVLSLNINGTAVQYTVLAADVGATDSATYGNIASKLASAIAAATSSVNVTATSGTVNISAVTPGATVTLALDDTKYVSGGTLDTASGGSIDIESVDGITITGVLGQRVLTDGDLGGAKVSDIRIESLSGDVNLLRNTNVRDTLKVLGNSVGVLSGSYVYATGSESSLYLRARNALVLSGRAVAAELDPAIAKAAKMVHMVAPTMTVNGTIDVTSLTGRALLSAGSAVTVGGTIVSKGGIDVHAGVNMAWSQAQMAGTVTRANLSGGNITIVGQGLL
ncbi:hypothetical protein JZU54_01185, partial [bacterium]|nr:hypothetical protein [bacterium]